MPSRIELCKVEEVGAGEVRKVEAAGLTVAVYNLDGDFCVTDDHCTHGPASSRAT
jgi:nitrite reductase/ring-hydroxylating ferredoxin subunit